MKPIDDPEHLDFIAFSAHKMYAPYGAGVLVGLKDVFNQGEPDIRGGGAVDLVTLDSVIWAPAPDRDEAGSPNIPGVIALMAAIKMLQQIGMETVAQHEAELTAYALRKFSKIPGIQLFGDKNPEKTHERVGLITFAIEGIPHNKVTAILGYEFGIGVRSGCFCAHPLVSILLGVGEYMKNEYKTMIEKGLVPNKPGMIRCSFGLFNTERDVDALIDALNEVIKGNYKGEYVQDSHGEYIPKNWSPDVFEEVISIKELERNLMQASLTCTSTDSNETLNEEKEDSEKNEEKGKLSRTDPVGVWGRLSSVREMIFKGPPFA